jgi:hypothetical protein
MPPVSWSGVLEVDTGCFPTRKEAYRVGGEGGPLGTGRCSTSLYKEALVNPKSSPGLSAPEFVDKSVSCLLEHCLGWDTPLEKEEAEEVSSPLLQVCSPLNVPTLCRLLTQGCDPNLTSSRGRNALHLLIASPSNPSTCPHLLLPAASVLIQAGASLDQRDLEGSTPLVSLACLLEQKQFAVAAQLATLFLTSDTNCDVNSVNLEGRSLLSYSVTYLDSSAELTRLLVNHGARVWPSPTVPKNPTVDQIRQDKEQSAFTWFLRAVIKQRTLASTDTTLNCLSHEMGKQPRRMKAHVLRVMVSEGRHPRVLGPVFLQMKLSMEPFWSEPQDLRYLAWNSVRRALGPRRLERASGQLGLPPPLTRYLTLAQARRPTFK